MQPPETYKKQEYNDFGLGEKATSGHYRVLKKDGSFNIHKDNVPFLERLNFFHTLVTMSWPRFLLLVGRSRASARGCAGDSWRLLGLSWRDVGRSWGLLGPLGPLLALSWRLLEPSWRVLRRSWGLLGPS